MARRSGRGAPRAVWLALPVLVLALLAPVGCIGPGAPREDGAKEHRMTPDQMARLAQAEPQLHSADATVRLQAAIALLSIGHPDGLEAVLESMRMAEDANERISAIRAAAFCRDHRCFPALLAAVEDPHPEVQREAALALARFSNEDEVAAMIALVNRKDVTADQRQLLFQAFGKGLALKAVPVLLKGLADEDAQTRNAAVEAMEDISARRFGADVARWTKWWEANAHRSREDILDERLQSMAEALQNLTNELNRRVEQQDELMELVRLPEANGLKPLLKALVSDYANVREYASLRLAGFSSERLKNAKLDAKEWSILKTTADDDSIAIRRNVIRFIVRLEGDVREELVRKALDDEDSVVLVAAIGAVGTGTGAAAQQRLAKLLRESSYREVREAAANTLGKVGSKDSVPALVAALADEAENVRWFAVEGLRKLGASETHQRVAELLAKDPNARVREIAAGTLGAFGQPASVPPIAAALDDGDERVRQKATAALLSLAAPDAAALENAAPNELAAVVAGMANIAGHFVAHKLPEPAKQILTRIIEQFSDREELRGRVVQAYHDLAGILEEQKDFAGAAKVWEKLDALTQGIPEVRRALIENWTLAKDSSRLAAIFEGWLAAPNADGALVQLGLDTVDALIQARKPKDAGALLGVVAKSAGDEANEETKNRIAELRERLGS